MAEEVLATAEDRIQDRRLGRIEQRQESYEHQLEKLSAQVNALTVAFAPFKVIEDVIADIRKAVELLREKNII